MENSSVSKTKRQKMTTRKGKAGGSVASVILQLGAVGGGTLRRLVTPDPPSPLDLGLQVLAF